jgi:hypothetical protein
MAGGIFEVCPFLVPIFFLMFVFDSMTWFLHVVK